MCIKSRCEETAYRFGYCKEHYKDKYCNNRSCNRRTPLRECTKCRNSGGII